MLSGLRIRSVASLVAVAFSLGACGDGTTLPTTIDPVEMQADIAAFEAGFESPATQSFASVGYAIDFALGGGALLRVPAMMVEEGPAAPAVRFRERLINASTDDIANAIPVSALGKTFVYSVAQDRYIVSALTGAPANGVRFHLYQLVPETGIIAVPLVQVGYVDITRSSSGTTLTGRIEVYATGGTKVMDYSATVGGTASVPTFSVTGFAGVGANRVNFTLNTGISLTTGALTITWQTELPSRNATSRVQLAVGSGENPSVTIGAMMRAGVRKVEVGGSFGYFSGGTLTVKVGGRVFATITITQSDVIVEDRNGNPLSAEDEETLYRIMEWFEGTFEVPDALLAPLFSVLDVAGFG